MSRLLECGAADRILWEECIREKTPYTQIELTDGQMPDAGLLRRVTELNE
jgi:hypothetical protein